MEQCQTLLAIAQEALRQKEVAIEVYNNDGVTTQNDEEMVGRHLTQQLELQHAVAQLEHKMLTFDSDVSAMWEELYGNITTEQNLTDQ